MNVQREKEKRVPKKEPWRSLAFNEGKRKRTFWKVREKIGDRSVSEHVEERVVRRKERFRVVHRDLTILERPELRIARC